MSFFVLIHDLASLGETADDEDDDDRNNGLTLNSISQPSPCLPAWR